MLQKSLLELVYTYVVVAGRGTGDPQTLDDFNPFASFGGCFYSQFQCRFVDIMFSSHKYASWYGLFKHVGECFF
ncbi:Protein CBG27141 [Caenorhabditis briggsae]|uniref:Protein CBG27141 n=1 Tax=Caenorhabditis briggsae TaxID=6238 RepID=B6IL51_CAEBR|nr:Protein CBG27141 [Caenorhabditis briggsae]CAS00604.1 Protein CBG27141 [Caenorhabditis briggsae]